MLNDADFRLARAAMQSGSIADARLLEGLLGERTLSDFLVSAGFVSADDILDMMANARPLEREEVAHYRALEELGQGGMGTVYKAFDTRLKRFIALKLLQRTGAEDIARFRREAETVAALDHPGIVKVYEFGEEGGLHYLAMQLIHGRPASLVELTPRRAAEVVRDAARAVAYAHDRGIIHRDLKPSNLMIDEADRVVVMDFGLARVQKTDSSLSASGAVIGTPVYMAPEQARGESRNLDARVDVYGLGATLYHLASRRTPFAHPNVYEILEKVVREEPPTIRGFNPNVHMDLQTIIAKAMEKERERRYPTAEALAADLHRYLDGEPISARRIGLVTRTVKRIRRRPWVSAAIAASALLVAALVSIPVVLKLQAAREAQERAELLDAINRINQLALKIERWDQNFFLADVDLAEHYPELEAILADLVSEKLRFKDAYEADYHRARALHRLGRLDKAMAALDEALSVYDRRQAGIDGSLLRGVILYERGRIRLERLYERRITSYAYGIRLPAVEARLEEEARCASADLSQAFAAGGMTEYQRDFAGVNDALARGAYEEARAAAEAMRRSPDRDALLLESLARAYIGLKRYPSAEEVSDRACQIRRNDPRLYIAGAAVYLSQIEDGTDEGRGSLYDKSEAVIRAGLKVDSRHAFLHAMLTRVRVGRFEFNRSDPRAPDVRFAEIEPGIEEMLKVAPDEPGSLFAAAYACRVLQRAELAAGRWDEAIRVGDRGIAFADRGLGADPDHIIGLVDRGLIYSERGMLSYGAMPDWLTQLDRGLEDTLRLHREGGSSFKLFQLLRLLYFHRGGYREDTDPEEAREDLLEAVRYADEQERLDPTSLDPLVDRGGAYVMLGDISRRNGRPCEMEFQKAVADLERVLAANPQEAHALRYLGRALHRLGRTREALAAWDRMIELEPSYLKWVQSQYDEARRELNDQ